MKRRTLSLCALGAIAVLAPPSRAADRPNVVFILADDLGWADTTLYGHTTLYRTPNVERLAKRGMTFTRAYSASPLCSPTRSAILTGLSPARTGITSPNGHSANVVLQASSGVNAPTGSKVTNAVSVTRLKTDYPTLPKALRAAGYATGHFGKWHLGHSPYSPLEHAFDVDLPHWPGPGPAGSYVAPWKFKDFDHDPDVPDQHIEDRMAREAVAWIERHREEPFLLNYWMFSVHAPFDAKRDLIDRYRGRVRPDDPQRSPTYAAMVESMDDAVGTLLDTLDRLQLADNTIVVFTSDNGGNMYNEVDGTTPTSNAPLRGGKATLYEGGVRVPCIVAWPGHVEPGSRSDALVQSEDFLPTLLDALDLAPQPDQLFDGASLLPTLLATPAAKLDAVPYPRSSGDDERAVFTYFPHAPGVPDWMPPAVAVHRGNWKLIRQFHQGEQGADRHLLFDLHDDLGEKRDLSGEQPQRVAELGGLIDRFLADTGAAVPIPNPRFDPAQYRPDLEGVQKLAGKTPAKPVAGGEANDSALADWKARNCTAVVRDGVVTVSSSSETPFLGVGAGVAGPAKLTFRTRCEKGGAGKVEWIPAKGEPQSVPFSLQGGDWQSVDVAIPAKGPLGIVRLHLPAAGQAVDVDWIELDPENGKSRRWDF